MPALCCFLLKTKGKDLPGVLSGVLSSVLSDVSSNVLSNVLSDVLSDVSFDILSDTVAGWQKTGGNLYMLYKSSRRLQELNYPTCFPNRPAFHLFLAHTLSAMQKTLS